MSAKTGKKASSGPGGGGGGAAAAATAGAGGADTDSQLDQAAPAQFAATGLGRMDAILGDEEDDEGDAGLDELQVAVQRLIKAKAAKKQQKTQAIVQDLQATQASQVKALQQAAAKDTKDCLALATRAFNTLAKKLEDKAVHIEALNTRYQQDLHAAWEDYNQLYSTLEDTKEQVLAVADKRRVSLKRKVAALASSSKQQLAEAERKVAKISSTAQALPNLSSMLQQALNAVGA